MSDSKPSAAAEYAIGTLPLSERREFERRLAVDERLRAEVAAWERDLSPLLDSVPQVEMTPSAWERIVASIDADESAGKVVPFQRPKPGRRIAAGVFGAIAASVFGFALLRNPGGEAPATRAPQPAQASAPSLPPAATGQPQISTARAAPCPGDPRKDVQIAKGVAEPSRQPDPAVNPITTASGLRGQGAVVLGGRQQIADQQAGESKAPEPGCASPAPGR